MQGYLKKGQTSVKLRNATVRLERKLSTKFADTQNTDKAGRTKINMGNTADYPVGDSSTKY